MFEDSFLDSFMESHIGGWNADTESMYDDHGSIEDWPGECEDDDEYDDGSYDADDERWENADLDFDQSDW